MKRRKSIRRMSSKRAKLVEESREVFAEFMACFPVCWSCRSKPTSEIHHLCSGAFRAKTYADRRGFFATCRECHKMLQSGKIPLVVALVAKWRHDPEYFSLSWINKSRGRVPSAITRKDLGI